MNKTVKEYYRQVETGLLRKDGTCGRDGADDGSEKVPRGLCQLLLPEPGIHMPAAPDDAPEDHKGIETAERGK